MPAGDRPCRGRLATCRVPCAFQRLLAGGAGFTLRDKTLFDLAGHPVEFSLITNSGNETREKIAAMVQQDLAAISAAMAGGVIAFYQLGYGIAAFGVGPLHDDGGVSLSAIFGFTAVIAALMGLLSFFVTRRRTAPGDLVTAAPGAPRPESTSPLRSESP